jgi:hypothetical protein
MVVGGAGIVDVVTAVTSSEFLSTVKKVVAMLS